LAASGPAKKLSLLFRSSAPMSEADERMVDVRSEQCSDLFKPSVFCIGQTFFKKILKSADAFSMM
jgi:hypothetical protein